MKDHEIKFDIFNVTKTVPEVSLLALATAWQPVNQLVFHESYILQLKT